MLIFFDNIHKKNGTGIVHNAKILNIYLQYSFNMVLFSKINNKIIYKLTFLL